MATQRRFIIKNGLDNNNLTIQNVADPVNVQDVATKNFSSNASNLTSGTVGTARLGTGTANSTTYLRGDGTWAVAGSAGTSYNFSLKTANYTAVKSDFILANTTAGGFTVTLPATPTEGDSVIIVDKAGTWSLNNLTIARNGSTIQGAASNITVTTSNQELQFIYIGGTWEVYSLNIANYISPTAPVLSGNSAAYEMTTVNLTIANFQTQGYYTIVAVSGGSAVLSGNVVQWTLPAVSTNTNHTIQVSYTNAAGSSSITYTMNVLNSTSTADSSVLWSLTSFVNVNDGWV